MLSGKPLFNSVCGQPLWKTVVFLGFLTLGLIFILTGFNAYMVSKGYEDDGAGTKRGVQIVLIILSLVLGVWRSMLLIFGAKPDWPIQGNRSSFLFLWMIITLITFIFRFFLLIWIAINSINGWDPTDTSELEVWFLIIILLFNVSTIPIVYSLDRKNKELLKPQQTA